MAQNNLANAVADALLALLGLVVVVVGEVERVGGLVGGQRGVAYAKVLAKGEEKKEEKRAKWHQKWNAVGSRQKEKRDFPCKNKENRQK